MEITFKEVIQGKAELLKANVGTDVIFNRFDIKYGNNFKLYEIDNGFKKIYVPIFIDNQTIRIGVYLRPISKYTLDEVCKYIFANYKKIKKIEFVHCLTPFDNDTSAKPHWHIDLPTSIEVFDKTLSKQTRYNTKWYPKKIERELGGYKVKKHVYPDIPVNIVEMYFQFKKRTHGTDYKLNADEYLKKFYITEAYVLYLKNCEIGAILFNVTTDKNVFLENLSYNSNYKEYSLATVLYYYVISQLILERKEKYFLLGGEIEYKRRFNGVKTLTYTGELERCPAWLEWLHNKTYINSPTLMKIIFRSISWLTFFNKERSNIRKWARTLSVKNSEEILFNISVNKEDCGYIETDYVQHAISVARKNLCKVQNRIIRWQYLFGRQSKSSDEQE